MTDFLLVLAKNYEGVAWLDKIHRQIYPYKSEEKNCRFDPSITQTVMCLINNSNRYVNHVYVARVPISLRDRCTIASDGGVCGGEEIYLLPSDVPDIHHPVIMSHTDLKKCITKALTAFQYMRTPKHAINRSTNIQTDSHPDTSRPTRKCRYQVY